MILDSKRQVYEHVGKAFSLYGIPAQTFNADVVTSLSELFALKANFMSMKLNLFGVPIVSRPQ